jgi:hypothetical protein
MFVDQAIAVGMADSVIATPRTSPNGIAGMNNGNAARSATATPGSADVVRRSEVSSAMGMPRYDQGGSIPQANIFGHLL